MCICSAGAVGNDPNEIYPPSTVVPRRLPARTMSEVKRLIDVLRATKMSATKGDYRRMNVQNIQSIGIRVGTLKRRFAWNCLTCTAGNIDSAFRRINSRPDASIIMNTEPVGKELCLEDDPVFFYLALHFVWNGSTGAPPSVGDI